MSNYGKIKLKKKDSGGKLAGTIMFVLIFLLSVSTIITIQIKSQKRSRQEMEQTAQTAVTDYEQEYKIPDEPTQPVVEQDISQQYEPPHENAVEHQEQPAEQVSGAIQQTTEQLKFVIPVDGKLIKQYSDTKLFYSETLDDWRQHLGIDIGCVAGCQVNSMADGTVYDIYNDIEYGNTIIIDHGNGIMTKYSNVDLYDGIIKQAAVKQGQALGSVQKNPVCEASASIHLHVEAMKDNVYVNPLSLVE